MGDITSENEVEKAYQRGLREGQLHALLESVDRAHIRLDKHEVRVTALERVMYAGMGVLAVIQIIPALTDWAQT